jgi:hypothetical protein
MTKVEIKNAITKILIENPNADRKKIALDFNVSNNEVGAIFAALKRFGKIDTDTVEATINIIADDNVSVLDKCSNFLTAKAEKIAKVKNTYSNEDGIKKDEARNKIVNSIEIEGLTLSLPNEHPIIEERMLNKLPKSSFLGVECVEDTYKNLVKIVEAKALPMKTKLGFIEDFVYGKSKNTYANIIFDFCRGLHVVHEVIEHTVNNDIVAKNGIIAITCTRMIRNAKGDFVDFFNSLGNYITNDTRKRIDKKFEHYFNRILNPLKYKIVELHPYKDKGKHAMMLIIIKRIA